MLILKNECQTLKTSGIVEFWYDKKTRHTKLDIKHLVLLLISYIAGSVDKPDFLECHRREILYTWTRPFVVETKTYCKISKKKFILIVSFNLFFTSKQT